MSGPLGASSGAPLGDDDLGRLLAEGLRRDAEGPVDERALVRGARLGAARIRRRRATVTAVTAVLIVGVPAGVVGLRLVQGGTTTGTSMSGTTVHDAGGRALAPSAPEGAGAAGTASTGEAFSAAQSRSGDAPASAGSATGNIPAPMTVPGAAGTSPATARVSSTLAPTMSPTRAPGASATSLPRAAAGVVIPAQAMLTAVDIVSITSPVFTSSSDTANRTPPPNPVAGDVCGASVSGLPGEAGGRAVAFQRGQGASGWSFTSTVRVFAGSGAAEYLAVVRRQGCLAGTATGGSGTGVEGHGTADAEGRVHWYALATMGRTTTEVFLVAPQGVTVADSDVANLLSVAAGRLESSGLPAEAAVDPTLG